MSIHTLTISEPAWIKALSIPAYFANPKRLKVNHNSLIKMGFRIEREGQLKLYEKSYSSVITLHIRLDNGKSSNYYRCEFISKGLKEMLKATKDLREQLETMSEKVLKIKENEGSNLPFMFNDNSFKVLELGYSSFQPKLDSYLNKYDEFLRLHFDGQDRSFINNRLNFFFEACNDKKIYRDYCDFIHEFSTMLLGVGQPEREDTIKISEVMQAISIYHFYKQASIFLQKEYKKTKNIEAFVNTYSQNMHIIKDFVREITNPPSNGNRQFKNSPSMYSLKLAKKQIRNYKDSTFRQLFKKYKDYSDACRTYYSKKENILRYLTQNVAIGFIGFQAESFVKKNGYYRNLAKGMIMTYIFRGFQEVPQTNIKKSTC
jgi:hypothetical protein